MKRECGVESAKTVCGKIVSQVKLNEEQSLLCKYLNLSVYGCILKSDIRIGDCYGKELIVPMINSITELKICILDRSMVQKGHHS